MTVVMHTGSYCALTAPSMTHMTSLTKKLLVSFITNLVFALHLAVTGKTITGSLVILWGDLEFTTLEWCI